MAFFASFSLLRGFRHVWCLRTACLSFAADRAGAMAVTIALLMTTFAGFVGLSVDAAEWYSARRVMISQVDAAAIGGALKIFENGTVADAIAAATTDANLNGNWIISGAVLSVSVDSSARIITATLTKTADMFLSKLFLASAPTISVTAKAGLVNAGPPVCFLSTNPTASGALSVTGNGSITASGCGVVVDSSSSNAMYVTGNGTIAAKQLCGPGGYSGAGYSPIPSSCVAMQDPLASWPAPGDVNADCSSLSVVCKSLTTYKVSGSGTTTLSPGVYVGGISVGSNATVNFQPGVYILRDGALTGTGNAVINGTGVSFYITGSGTAVQLQNDDTSITGNVTVNITAPTSGPMAGIAIYQDDFAATGTITNKLAGNGSVNFTGVLYFGNQNVTVSGNGTQNGQSAFTAIIANTLIYNGNGTLNLNANYANTSVPLPPGMALPIVSLLQ